MKRDPLEKYQPNMRFFLLLLLLVAVFTFFFGEYRFHLAAAEALLVALLAVYMKFSQKKRAASLLKYIESVANTTQSATKDTLLNFPLPVVIFNPNSQVVLWSNRRFAEAAGLKERFFDTRLGDIIPAFPIKWLFEGKSECPELVELKSRRYKAYGSLLHSVSDPGSVMAAVYMVDITEYADKYEESLNARPVCAIIMLDNYDELVKNLSEKDKSAILSAIDDKIGEWISGSGGILCKYDRDRYLFLFEHRHLKDFAAGRFSVLDSVRRTVNASGIHATLSIGVGVDGGTFEENFHFASLAIEMALSRGGDQAVIKNRFSFEFYGGHSSEVEKRTKVKSRVMASAFGELVSNASAVFVMGHRYADLDSIGAAAGICCIARKRSVAAYIVTDLKSAIAENLVARLRQAPEYEGTFITAQDAMLIADSKSLLVVVDTNRPDQVESEALLQSCNHVAVIDHHRRAAAYIENAALNFHEPYASSSAELVTEMLQYLVEQPDVMRVEAEALLSGIVLDTKSFTVRTGSRTFDAAAYLRRCGADTTEVKRLLQSDFEATMKKYAIIRLARIIRPGVAVAFSETSENRVIIAQAADELLNIAGIHASFVVAPDGDDIFISARSIGNLNVQIVMEKLGGGGNQSTAGAKLSGETVAGAIERLTAAIDDCLGSSPQHAHAT